MQDITENPAFPIIQYLQEQIKEEEVRIEHFKENHQHPMADYNRKMAVHRMYAFKEVLDFIEGETFKPE